MLRTCTGNLGTYKTKQGSDLSLPAQRGCLEEIISVEVYRALAVSVLGSRPLKWRTMIMGAPNDRSSTLRQASWLVPVDAGTIEGAICTTRSRSHFQRVPGVRAHPKVVLP